MLVPEEPQIEGGAPGDAPMPFVQHLRELRICIRNAIMFLLAGFVVAYFFKQDLLVLLLRPLVDAWNNHGLGEARLIFSSPTEAFWAYVNLSLWAGFFLASPFIFHQVWRFIAPGLHRHESRWGLVFSLGSACCFSGGAVFCYAFVLSPVHNFLLGFASDNLATVSHALGIQYELSTKVALEPLLSVQSYLQFARKLLLGFGLVFELPILITVLSAFGIVTHRSLWKFNRWWIVLSFVISAILTPPDPASQTLMAGPLIILYNLSIGIAFLFTKKRERVSHPS